MWQFCVCVFMCVSRQSCHMNPTYFRFDPTHTSYALSVSTGVAKESFQNKHWRMQGALCKACW